MPMNLRQVFRSSALTVAGVLAWSCLPLNSWAGGFELQGQSAEGVGYAQAGAVSGYDDGSAAISNPAALAIHDRPVISFGSHYVPLHFDFHDRGSTVLGMDNTGSDRGEHRIDGYIPNFYYVQPISGSVTGALFATSPYGLATRYRSNFVGRYQAEDSSLQSLQMGGAASYEITPSFSIGASISSLYAKASLGNAVDFGTIGSATLGPETAGMLGLYPQANDGEVNVEGSDWTMGWQLGALYRYGDERQNRIGVS